MQRALHIAIALLSALPLAAQENYAVTPVDLTPMGQDYAPVLVDSMVVMCSLREREGLIGYRDAKTDDPFSDLYTFSWDGTKAGTPHLLSESLATPLNDGPASFSMDGNTICFTRNQTNAKNLGRSKAQDDRLGLFFSARQGDEWTVPVAFQYNSMAFDVTHPALSPDGERLYFASNMPGGSGGMDLYVCDLGTEGWNIPTNLGKSVNTAANEVFPFIDANGALYFSSDREGGVGKLDIYQALPSGTSWGAPRALPEPMNSTGNDIGYSSFSTDRSGFFSSDRAGSDRIYAFRRTVPYFANCAEQQENNYCYVFNEPDKRIPEGLPLHCRWNMGDGSIIDGPKAEHCYKGPGHYAVSLDMVDDTSGSVFFHEATYDLPIDDTHQPYITCLDSARSGKELRVDGLHTYLPGTSVEEFHWDLGDGTFADGRNITHAWTTPGQYVVKLDVQGVERGSRAIVSHCVTKTISVIKHFEDVADAPVLSQYKDAAGDTREFSYQSLPFDNFDMAVKENEDVSFSVQIFASKERLSLNDPRFADIKRYYPVYERFDPTKGEYTYSVGKAKDLTEMYEIYKKVKELRFLDAEVVAIHPEKVTDLSALALLNEQDLNNSVVRASTVLFENDKSTVAQAFEPQLDKVRELLMLHPQLDVVIEAHTDANGGDEYNLKLSQQRAQSIVDDLLRGGVHAERMTAVGHGENHPIADNNTADGRAQNRRVEFRLVMREDQAYEKRK